MKTSKVITLGSCLVIGALLAGCAKDNYQKGSAAGADLQQSGSLIGQANAKIDACVNTLKNLVDSPQGDLVNRFKLYSTAVGELQSTAEHVKSKVSGMRETGNEYFKAWDEQAAKIQNEDIKNRSAERKAEMQKRFTEIKAAYIKAGDEFRPFMQNLKDIQTALSTDLTSGGVSAIKGVADKTIADSEKVKASVNELATKFRELGVAMSAAAPQPAPK
jgi:IS1 family transposase